MSLTSIKIQEASRYLAPFYLLDSGMNEGWLADSLPQYHSCSSGDFYLNHRFHASLDKYTNRDPISKIYSYLAGTLVF